MFQQQLFCEKCIYKVFSFMSIVVVKQLLPTNVPDSSSVTTTTDRVRTEQERKLTKLQRNKDKIRPKTDDNWVRNISSRLPVLRTKTLSDA